MNYLERIAASATESLLSPRIQPAGASVHGDAEAFELRETGDAAEEFVSLGAIGVPAPTTPRAPYASEPNREEPRRPDATAPDRDAVARAATRDVSRGERSAKTAHTKTAQTNRAVARADDVIGADATRTGGVSESDGAANADREPIAGSDGVPRTGGELDRGAGHLSRRSPTRSVAPRETEPAEAPAANRTAFVARAPHAWRSRARRDSLAAERAAHLTDSSSHAGPASPHAVASPPHAAASPSHAAASPTDIDTLPPDVAAAPHDVRAVRAHVGEAVAASPARRAAGIAPSDTAEEPRAPHDAPHFAPAIVRGSSPRKARDDDREPRLSIGRIDVTVRGGVSFVPPAPSLPSAPPANAPLFNRFALGG